MTLVLAMNTVAWFVGVTVRLRGIAKGKAGNT